MVDIQIGKIYKVWETNEMKYFYMFVQDINKNYDTITYNYLGGMSGTYTVSIRKALMFWEDV